DVEFQFDEVVSEGGTPNQGQGTGGLEKLVILSPTTQVPEVSWRRSRITVKPREGWRPNRIYRVQLLPGVTDLRNNPSDEGAVLTFSTGAPRPQNTLQGRVVDWSTSRPAPAALVVASLLPDSLPYRGVADSSGRFSLGPLPTGEYLVSGVLDQNKNFVQDPREAFGSARVAAGRSEVGELWAFVHDTVPPRIQTATADDSVSATLTFTQKLDPRQRLSTGDVRLRLLPDSVPVAVASILPKPVDDSLNRRTTRAAADTAAADTSEAADSAPAPRRPQRRQPERPEAGETLTGRPALFERLVLRVPRPWAPGARLVVEIRGVRNVTGAAGTAVGVIAVPERPKPTARDTARAAGRRDTTRARTPPRQPATPPRR
ncbi:MAG TPA: Ig-like domain-containing protein, partial [Gemmatimonadales bacterium]|nr:Ig-like domain-containing protein [Gemmatimonadales bacterium]